MTEAEFVKATTRLENYFDKEYKSEQQKIMYDFLREWSVEKYNKAINYCIRNCKYLPKIADLTNADTATVNIQSNVKLDFTKCNKCNGEGFTRYFKNIKDGTRIIKYEYIALCTCENAKKQRSANGYNFPTLTELGLEGGITNENNSKR